MDHRRHIGYSVVAGIPRLPRLRLLDSRPADSRDSRDRFQLAAGTPGALRAGHGLAAGSQSGLLLLLLAGRLQFGTAGGCCGQRKDHPARCELEPRALGRPIRRIDCLAPSGELAVERL